MKAKTQVKFTGKSDITIPKGTVVSTVDDRRFVTMHTVKFKKPWPWERVIWYVALAAGWITGWGVGLWLSQ